MYLEGKSKRFLLSARCFEDSSTYHISAYESFASMEIMPQSGSIARLERQPDDSFLLSLNYCNLCDLKLTRFRCGRQSHEREVVARILHTVKKYRKLNMEFRSISVSIPAVSISGTRKVWCPRSFRMVHPNIAASTNVNEAIKLYPKMSQKLVSKLPEWNSEAGNLVVKFEGTGRILTASAKNFILLEERFAVMDFAAEQFSSTSTVLEELTKVADEDGLTSQECNSMSSSSNNSFSPVPSFRSISIAPIKSNRQLYTKYESFRVDACWDEFDLEARLVPNSYASIASPVVSPGIKGTPIASKQSKSNSSKSRGNSVDLSSLDEICRSTKKKSSSSRNETKEPSPLIIGSIDDTGLSHSKDSIKGSSKDSNGKNDINSCMDKSPIRMNSRSSSKDGHMDYRDQLESGDRVDSRDRRIKSTKSLDTAVKDKRPKGNYCVLVRLLILSFMILHDHLPFPPDHCTHLPSPSTGLTVTSSDQPHAIVQFGKTSPSRYVLDFKFPMSPLQAFAVALSVFAYDDAAKSRSPK